LAPTTRPPRVSSFACAGSAAKVMGSSLIMHKEPKKQGGLSGSKRGGGAGGPQASAGGIGEQETKEVRAELVLPAAYIPKASVVHPVPGGKPVRCDKFITQARHRRARVL